MQKKKRAGKRNTHRGARTHDHKVKSLALCRLSQAGFIKYRTVRGTPARLGTAAADIQLQEGRCWPWVRADGEHQKEPIRLIYEVPYAMDLDRAFPLPPPPQKKNESPQLYLRNDVYIFSIAANHAPKHFRRVAQGLLKGCLSVGRQFDLGKVHFFAQRLALPSSARCCTSYVRASVVQWQNTSLPSM